MKLKVENFDLLRDALKNDSTEGLSMSIVGSSLYGEYRGYRFEINGKGEVVVDSSVASETANAINRAYSRQVVRQASKKFGWTIKEKNTNNTEYTVSKRGL
ncbi:MAG: hypothetical protein ACO3L1_00180 [Flavobacteriaceae bacterium]